MPAYWVCMSCEIECYLPAMAEMTCSLCRQSLLKGRISGPPSAPPPPPPSDPSEATATPMPERLPPRDFASPMKDFFTLYLPSAGRNAPLKEPSLHPFAEKKLLRNPLFLKETGLAEGREKEDLDARVARRYALCTRVISKQRMVLRHAYVQDWDLRMYDAECSNGWCLGAVAYWLKWKKRGVNVFPDIFHDDPELSEPHSPLQRLMSNQEYLLKLRSSQVETGGTDRYLKNPLDYIAGGASGNPAPVLSVDYGWPSGRIGELADRFLGMHEAQGGQEDSSRLFVVLFRYQAGGKHAMGLDLTDVELFDPNYGVMTAARKDWQQLVAILFSDGLRELYSPQKFRSFSLYAV